jgi:hypothetical protein
MDTMSLIFYFVLAIAYIYVSKFMLKKFTKSEKVKEFHEEMKKLQKDFWDAAKNKNLEKMEEINKKQLEKTKELPFLFKEQIKISLITLSLFFVFVGFIDFIDDEKRDDIKFWLNKQNNFSFSIGLDKLKDGTHFVYYEGENKIKGEIKYELKDLLNAKEITFKIDEDSYISLIYEKNTIYYKSTKDLMLIDDNATRTELSLPFIGSLHGLWLFIFSVLFINFLASIFSVLKEKLKKFFIEKS